MFCQPAAKENPIAQTKDDLDHLMRISADVAELFEKNDARENLKTEILINFKKLLEDDFKNDLFRKMGKILDERHAILEDVTKDYGRVKSNDQFHRLFKEAKEKKGKDYPGKNIILNIVITHITVDKIVEHREVEGETPDERTVDMIARVIFTYHIMPEGGSLEENQGGGGSGEYLHRKVCTWY
jgi:hypothetical protein